MARHVPPFDCDIVALGPKGQGLGTDPSGRPVRVRGGIPGSRVTVRVTGRKNGVLLGRATALVSPPPGAVAPRCAVFGSCGGCTLQRLPLDRQRELKHGFALAEIGDGLLPAEPVIHPVRGADEAYGYRNKVELGFGPIRWLEDHEVGALDADGTFLGFHAPGRFDRVVDLRRCELVSEHANSVVDVVRRHMARAPAWDPRTHAGFWRHLLIREHQGRMLVALFTGDDAQRDLVEALDAELPPEVVGFRWYVNRGVADVARGDLVWARGADHLVEELLGKRFEVSTTSFFQTNTRGTEVLYATIAELCGTGGTLLDLYCGSGTIGQTLASGFDRVVGVEENLEAIEDARRNARHNGVPMELIGAKVEQRLDEILAAIGAGTCTIVVDPPRAGLHPKVAAALARVSARELIYVACNPASLGRDGRILTEGGWRATDLHTVDLFPQTGHVEVVARFTR
ncbi:MAG: 23S rRNA (uracil(1939)-C(5))-methyltransferase RlmD [Alphaproteobacteria bacterium]|nr:23S rRNA (uracil(1939)-C(5))-methyltransferase RlmD [Alphaproteobacteria bacterium]